MFRHFLGDLFTKRRYLIVDEDDVVNLLKVFGEVNCKFRICIPMNMEIGSCGWAEEPTKWFVHFDATNKKWRAIIKTLRDAKREIVLRENEEYYLK